MSDIFICYARTDSAVAHRLAERLRAEGWSVFLDVQTRVGQRYDQVIESELETARAAVVLWSSASRKSNDVRDEAKFGRDRNILFPAWIERVNSPLGFGHIQTADLVGWGGEPDHPGLAQLLESLRLHLGGAPVAKPARRWVSTQALSREPEEGEAHPALAPAAPQRPVFTSVFSPGQTFRDRLKIGGEAPLMAVIPAGRFLMGSPPAEGADAEGPQHEVRIAGPFAMGVYAVTFDEYDRFAAAAHREKPGDQGWGRGKRPVINVSWEDG